MRRKMLSCCLALSVAPSTSFGGEQRCGIPILLGNPKLEEEVAVQLKANNIPVDAVEGVFCAPVDSREDVRRLVEEVLSKHLPSDHSTSLHKNIESAVIQSLEEQDIQFRRIKVQGMYYLVWSAGDSKKVKSIIAEEKRKFINSFMNSK